MLRVECSSPSLPSSILALLSSIEEMFGDDQGNDTKEACEQDLSDAKVKVRAGAAISAG